MRGGVRTDMALKEIKSEYLNGVYGDLAEILGVEAALRVHKYYRGQTVSFPVELYKKSYISSKIAGEYDGSNVKQLATKFGYSEKWIRKIIKENEK